MAKEHGLTLADAFHQAVTEWIDRHHRVDPDDPASMMLNELEALASNSAVKDSRETSNLVDEWDGSREEWRLAENPAKNSHSK